MAAVVVLGFCELEIFTYQGTRYEEYPDDTLAFFRNLFRDTLSGPNTLVIVAEVQKVQDDVTDLKEVTIVVIRICSWIFHKNSERAGQFSALQPVRGSLH